jgi:hypothetical protein
MSTTENAPDTPASGPAPAYAIPCAYIVGGIVPAITNRAMKGPL